MGCNNIDSIPEKNIKDSALPVKNNEDDVDEITIRYKIEDAKRIQIFGCDFE